MITNINLPVLWCHLTQTDDFIQDFIFGFFEEFVLQQNKNTVTSLKSFNGVQLLFYKLLGSPYFWYVYVAVYCIVLSNLSSHKDKLQPVFHWNDKLLHLEFILMRILCFSKWGSTFSLHTLVCVQPLLKSNVNVWFKCICCFSSHPVQLSQTRVVVLPFCLQVEARCCDEKR